MAYVDRTFGISRPGMLAAVSVEIGTWLGFGGAGVELVVIVIKRRVL